MGEVMNFHRLKNETTDALIQRFKMLKWRAAQGNAGINMTWEGYSWLLLKAVGLNQNTLIQLLQPTMGSMPNTEPQFEAMCMALRRLGHIFENTPHNIAHALHTPPGRMFPIFDQSATTAQPSGFAFPVGQDPWQTSGQDPWGGDFGAGNAFSSQPSPSQPAYGPNPFLQSAAAAPNNAYPVQQPPTGNVSGTDSDTESSFGEDINYDAPEYQGLTPAQISEKIWWGYTRAKSTWPRNTAQQ